MKDRFTIKEEAYNRLKQDYLTHGSLFVAFDFDDTIFPYTNKEDTFFEVQELLRRCNKLKFTLILFTAREGIALNFAKRHCERVDIKYDYVNENPIMDTRKPYWNILLDDKAGLDSAFDMLNTLVKEIENGSIKFSK